MNTHNLNGTQSFGPGDRELAQRFEDECRTLEHLIKQSHSRYVLGQESIEKLPNWTKDRQQLIIDATLQKLVPVLLQDVDIRVMALPMCFINVNNNPTVFVAQTAKIAIIDTTQSDDEIINELYICLKQHVALNKTRSQVYALYQPLIPMVLYDKEGDDFSPRLGFSTRFGLVNKV